MIRVVSQLIKTGRLRPVFFSDFVKATKRQQEERRYRQIPYIRSTGPLRGNVFNKLKERKLKSRLILQIHDELLIETKEEEKEEVKNILKTSMENAIKLKVPLRADVSEAYNWYDLK